MCLIQMFFYGGFIVSLHMSSDIADGWEGCCFTKHDMLVLMVNVTTNVALHVSHQSMNVSVCLLLCIS